MKKSISFAILMLMMAFSMCFTSCSGDDVIESIDPQTPTLTEWVEPYHVQGASVEDVKSFMSSSMKSYSLSRESTTESSSQLVYILGTSGEGIIYSFSSTGTLYSIVSTELCANKSVILEYLDSRYSLMPGSDSDDAKIQYLYMTSDRSMVISTLKLSDLHFSVSYTFVTR